MLSFGSLTRASFPSASSLQPLAEFVSTRENVSRVARITVSLPLRYLQREISVKVMRGSGETIDLTFTPRSGWGGRGLLG